MVKAHIERVIDVPLERAWEIISDFSNVQNIHPLVDTVDQLTSNGKGLGAVRRCNLYDGNEAIERIEAWDERNKTYTIKYTDGSLPMNSVDVDLKAVAVGKDQTKLVAEMSLKAKYGLLGKIMERLVIKPQLGGAVGNLFAGVESYDKTGVQVQKGFKAKTPALVV